MTSEVQSESIDSSFKPIQACSVFPAGVSLL